MKNRKNLPALTAVVSIIFLVGLVSLSAILSYVWITSVETEVQVGVGERTAEIFAPRVKIDLLSGGKLYLRNESEANVENVAIYVNGRLCMQTNLSPGVTEFDLNCPFPVEQGALIQVAYAGGSESAYMAEKKRDGVPCVSDEECASGHCSNGYCCSSGICCASHADCPFEYHCSNYTCVPTTYVWAFEDWNYRAKLVLDDSLSREDWLFGKELNFIQIFIDLNAPGHLDLNSLRLARQSPITGEVVYTLPCEPELEVVAKELIYPVTSSFTFTLPQNFILVNAEVELLLGEIATIKDGVRWEFSGPDLLDFDGDLRPEIVVLEQPCIDNVTYYYASVYSPYGILEKKVLLNNISIKDPLGTTTCGPYVFKGSLAYDLNGDGKGELLICDSQNLYLLDWNLNTIASVEGCMGVALLDLGLDGNLEIIAGGAAYDSNLSLIADCGIAIVSTDSVYERDSVAYDVDLDGNLEILINFSDNTLYFCELSYQGGTYKRLPDVMIEWHPLSVCDVNSTPNLDFCIGTADGNLLIFDFNGDLLLNINLSQNEIYHVAFESKSKNIFVSIPDDGNLVVIDQNGNVRTWIQATLPFWSVPLNYKEGVQFILSDYNADSGRLISSLFDGNDLIKSWIGWYGELYPGELPLMVNFDGVFATYVAPFKITKGGFMGGKERANYYGLDVNDSTNIMVYVNDQPLNLSLGSFDISELLKPGTNVISFDSNMAFVAKIKISYYDLERLRVGFIDSSSADEDAVYMLYFDSNYAPKPPLSPSFSFIDGKIVASDMNALISIENGLYSFETPGTVGYSTYESFLRDAGVQSFSSVVERTESLNLGPVIAKRSVVERKGPFRQEQVLELWAKGASAYLDEKTEEFESDFNFVIELSSSCNSLVFRDSAGLGSGEGKGNVYYVACIPSFMLASVQGFYAEWSSTGVKVIFENQSANIRLFFSKVSSEEEAEEKWQQLTTDAKISLAGLEAKS